MKITTHVLSDLLSGIRSVNKTYAKPSIEMTPFVQVSLFVLRLYVFGLVGLMIVKFILAARG